MAPSLLMARGPLEVWFLSPIPDISSLDQATNVPYADIIDSYPYTLTVNLKNLSFQNMQAQGQSPTALNGDNKSILGGGGRPF